MSECRPFLHEYTSCLHIHNMVVGKHMKEGATDLQIDTAIPFTIKVFEKVFLAPDMADIDEKDESDPDEKVESDQDGAAYQFLQPSQVLGGK